MAQNWPFVHILLAKCNIVCKYPFAMSTAGRVYGEDYLYTVTMLNSHMVTSERRGGTLRPASRGSVRLGALRRVPSPFVLPSLGGWRAARTVSYRVISICTAWYRFASVKRFYLGNGLGANELSVNGLKNSPPASASARIIPEELFFVRTGPKGGVSLRILPVVRGGQFC
jgi:hypothetical protein